MGSARGPADRCLVEPRNGAGKEQRGEHWTQVKNCKSVKKLNMGPKLEANVVRSFVSKVYLCGMQSSHFRKTAATLAR
jgi:hypothetical protein